MSSAKDSMLFAEGVMTSPAIASADADQHAAGERADHRAEPADDDDDEGKQRVARAEHRRNVDQQATSSAPAAPTQAAPRPKVSA